MMSEEQLKSFIRDLLWKVQEDTSIQEQLKTASDVDAVVAIVKTAGFALDFSSLDWTELTLEGRKHLTEGWEPVFYDLEDGWDKDFELILQNLYGFFRAKTGRRDRPFATVLGVLLQLSSEEEAEEEANGSSKRPIMHEKWQKRREATE